MADLRHAFRTIKPAYADVGCGSCTMKQYKTAIKVGDYITENSTLSYLTEKHANLKRKGIAPHLSLEEELGLYFGA